MQAEITAVVEAFELLRKKMRGDVKGQELAAFAGVDRAVAALRAAGSAEPVAWRWRYKGRIDWHYPPDEWPPKAAGQVEREPLYTCAPAKHERKMVAEISFDPTNHHNALKCPYCNPKGLTFAEIAPAESVREALRLLGDEDERQSKLHELLETIREQIRTKVDPEHRPDGLLKNIQDAVYSMRGRMPILNDIAIVSVFDALSATPLPQTVEKAAETVDTVETVAAEIAYFESHADRFAAAHKGITAEMSPIMQAASRAAETVAEPKNLPDSWDYMKDTNSVRCGGCLFRFGAEHPDSDGKWTCPNCGDGNGEKEAAAEPTREGIARQTIETIPRDGRRLILFWDDSDDIPMHFELGWWRDGSWRNTYGHPFSGEPTHWFDPLALSKPRGGTATCDMRGELRDGRDHSGCDKLP